MKLPEQEKAAQRAAFRAMSPEKKLEHIFTYYKWPILLGLAALVILGSTLYRNLTKKEPVLYLAFANVAVGEELERTLTGDFLLSIGADARHEEVYLYRDLYLSDDADTLNHEYAYASRMKLMGAVQAQKMDIVLMNGEAYDLLSRSGYLLPLGELPGLEDAALRQRLVSNEVTISDNAIEYQLGEAEEHEVQSETVTNALSLQGLPVYEAAGFPEPVYLGIIANTTHAETAASFLRYVADAAQP